MNADEVLKGLARESVKQGENLRTVVRELTLNALKGRELTVREIKRVVKAVTEGVNLGAPTSKIDADRVLGEAFAGMDEAVLKAVQANHLALQQLSAQGTSLRESHLKKALTELERLEDEFVASVKDATKKGSKQLRDQWATVLQQRTETAAEIERTMEEFGNRMHEAVKQQRRTALKAAESMAENFTTLASGILIGLTEGLQQGRSDPNRKGGS
jgi:hypothetical protein